MKKTKPAASKTLKIPAKSLIREHAHLVDVLRHDGKRAPAEAKEQSEELQEYRRKVRGVHRG